MTMAQTNRGELSKFGKSVLAVLTALLGLVCLANGAAASDETQAPPAPPFWRQNLRFAVDLVVRGMYESTSGEPSGAEMAVFDLHQVYSSERGDIGTLVVQGMSTIRNPTEPEGPRATFAFYNAYFNYTGLASNRFNVKVGHFELPYGLETTVATPGTLRDYTLLTNIGLKADWGVTLNGTLPRFEYEAGWTTGTGNHWTGKGKPYAFIGRAGTTRTLPFVVGLSAFAGRIKDLGRAAGVIDRTRVGVDAQWDRGSSALLGEVSLGREDHRHFVHALAEVDRYSRDRRFLGYSQLIATRLTTTSSRTESSLRLVVGGSVDLRRHWSLYAQGSRDLHLPNAKPEGNSFAIQTRYRR